ncbi:hypothetical protein QFZ68_006147 [Streptomyces sp. V1I6]|nr:hypothetical protein [Streptomyces sp. V1I6]
MARELIVSVHYPARPGRGIPAAYMSGEEARLLLEARGLGVCHCSTAPQRNARRSPSSNRERKGGHQADGV